MPARMPDAVERRLTDVLSWRSVNAAPIDVYNAIRATLLEMQEKKG